MSKIGNRTNFYSELFLNYSSIEFPHVYENLSKIDTNIQWYLSDKEQKLIFISKEKNKYIIDIDLSAAFLTICNNIFEKCEFLDDLNKIVDKKERNIFIALNLKAHDTSLLPIFNTICKMIIFGLIFDTKDKNEKNEILILELKKDGCLISVNTDTYYRLTHLSESTQPFTSFIIKHNFKYHIKEFDKYLRSNRTSYYLSQNLEIKGIYKYLPPNLLEIVEHIFLTNSIDNIDFDGLNKIYSTNYFKICMFNNLTNILSKWYICSNEKLLNKNLEYVSFSKNIDINPFNYIQTFLYPSILSTKL